MNASESIPKSASLLGWAGVLPFAGLSLAILYGLPSLETRLERLLIAYGAIILSFMGGVHWGLAMRTFVADRETNASWQYALSVAPALIGWGAIAIETSDAFIVLAIAFLALLVVDVTWASGHRAPAWYGRLRLQLTSVVLICLGVAWTSA